MKAQFELLDRLAALTLDLIHSNETDDGALQAARSALVQ
jgi:hypothetical protein